MRSGTGQNQDTWEIDPHLLVMVTREVCRVVVKLFYKFLVHFLCLERWWVYDIPLVDICGRHRRKPGPKMEHIRIVRRRPSLSIRPSSADSPSGI